jgi:hypothetical protein
MLAFSQIPEPKPLMASVYPSNSAFITTVTMDYKMGCTRGTHREEEEKYGYLVGNLKERDHLERIIVNCIKVDLTEIGWEGTDWPRTGTGDRQFVTW